MRSIAKLLVFFITVITMSCFFTLHVEAESRDYMVEDNKQVPIPETYLFKTVINNVGNKMEPDYLSRPEDLFINEQGYIFVVDTGNNRVLKLTKDGKFLNCFTGQDKKPLSSPKGIYVDEKGNMYIADTGNQRIVHLDFNGKFVEEFVKPDSELLGSSFTFDVSKIYLSPTGYIYALKGQNIMTIDAYNRFRGYVGKTEVGFSMVDVLLRFFASAEQKKFIKKRVASAYTNIVMDDQGLIYATSRDNVEGEIKKLNTIGKNIYRTYPEKDQNPLKFLKLKFEKKKFFFGERNSYNGESIEPLFQDICVDKMGIVTVIDRQTNRLYQYDQDGNNLTVFGGSGDQKGRFMIPSSIAVDEDGNIYVLDKSAGNIQVFEPTAFIILVQKAVTEYAHGNYEAANHLWNQVLSIHKNYQLAHVGVGNTLYKQEKWKDAMDEYRLADNRLEYSKAFTEYRYMMFRKYFVLVAISVIIGAGLFILMIKIIKKTSEKALDGFIEQKSKKMEIGEGLKMSLGVVFHPVQTYSNIKYGREQLSLVPGVIILILVLLVRIFNIFTVHYPLAVINIRDSNIYLEAVKLMLPIITWVIASFAISAIFDGESKLREIFLSATYSMIPYILVTVPLTILSQVLGRSEANFYSLLVSGTWIWILILFFVNLKILNDYHFGKTLVTYLLTGATMGLTWFVVLLGYVLTGRVYTFIVGILREVRMTWF